MNNGDYVILIDENGQPYIAHSVFTKARDAAKSAARSAHKYVAKIGEGAKARYFYTQEELKAFYNRGKAAAGKAAEAVRGAATKAATTAKSTASSVSKYASDRLGDVSDFVHRRNKVKSSGTSGTTDREINNSDNKMGAHDRADSASIKRQDSITGVNFRAAFDELKPGERDAKSKKRLGRGKTNIVDIDPNSDVKGRVDNRNERNDDYPGNWTWSNGDRYYHRREALSDNSTPYEARRQRLVQDILDAQDALGKTSRYSEEGHRAEEDLARAWRRLGEFSGNMYKGPIDDKYKFGKLTKKKK